MGQRRPQRLRVRGLGNKAVAINTQTFLFDAFTKTLPVTGGKLAKNRMAGLSMVNSYCDRCSLVNRAGR